MERIEKIGTALVMIALVAVLVNTGWRRSKHILDGDLNTPAVPRLTGPAYLTSALPIHRRNDDYADPSSYYVADGEPYSPQPWGIQ